MSENEEMGQNLFKQVMDLWAGPEIERRQTEGTLPTPVELRAVQVLFSIEGRPYVRINDEVRGKIQARLKVPKEKGDLIFANEIEEVAFGELLEEDRDFAHVTMIRVGESWYVFFSFLHGSSEAKATLDVGKLFLDSAKADIASGRLGPAVNNLFIAAEQIGRARLTLHPLEGNYRNGRSHGAVGDALHRYSHVTDIIPKSYAQAYQRLSDNLGAARGYRPGFKLSEDEMRLLAGEIEALWERTMDVLSQHVNHDA